MTWTLEKIKARCEEVDGCWLWTGPSSSGYPQIRIGKKIVNLRRHVMELAGKPLVGEQVVQCRCKEGMCMNPAHLFASTRKRVTRDIVKDGKLGTLAARIKLSAYQRPRSEKIGSIEVAREIRESKNSLKVEAGIRGVHPRTIWRIRNNQAWIDYSNPLTSMFR